MSDVFREVNDDLRREQLKTLWKRYGIYVIGVAVLIVLIVAGYQVLESIDASRSAESGDRYQAATDLYVAGDLEGAEAAFEAIAEDGYGGYKVLAMMGIGAIRAENGDVVGAVTAYDTVAGNPDAEPAIRDVAHIRAAFLLADTLTPDQMQGRVATFLEEGNPYRTLALEALVLTAVNTEEYDRAIGWVIDMVEDPYADDTINARANILFSYITGRQAELSPVAEAATPLMQLTDPFATETAPVGPPGFAATPEATDEATPAADPTNPAAPLQFELPGLATPLLPFLPGADLGTDGDTEAAPAAE